MSRKVDADFPEGESQFTKTISLISHNILKQMEVPSSHRHVDDQILMPTACLDV